MENPPGKFCTSKIRCDLQECIKCQSVPNSKGLKARAPRFYAAENWIRACIKLICKIGGYSKSKPSLSSPKL